MKTPYFNKELEYLEQGWKRKTNSFYENNKLLEYRRIKELIKAINNENI